MAGYTRQEEANITTGATIQASHFNNEFDAIETAFSSASGHTHVGSANGAAIPPAALSGLSAGGVVVRLTSTAFIARSFSAPAAGLTITNVDGSAGDFIFALADDLAGVEGMSTTGLVSRVSASSWIARTLTGTANEVTVTNGTGSAGDPTISLPSAMTMTGKTLTGGTYSTVVLRANAGTASAPGYGFAAETGMGMYRVSSGKMGFSVTSTEFLTIDTVAGVNIGGVLTMTGQSIDTVASTGSYPVPASAANFLLVTINSGFYAIPLYNVAGP